MLKDNTITRQQEEEEKNTAIDFAGITENNVDPTTTQGQIQVQDTNTLTDEQIQALVDLEEYKQKYDAPVTAAALGALRGASLGISDQAITRLGIMKPEELQAIKDESPVLSTTGQVAGTLAATLLPAGLGVGIAAKGAATAGAGAQRLTSRALASILKGSGNRALATRIIQNSIPAAAGSAVSGSLYSLGQLISEDALGSTSLNAENIVSYMSSGALISGAVGGMLGAAIPASSTALKKLKGKASELRGKTKKIGGDLLTSEDAAMTLFGLPDSEKARLVQDFPDIVEKMPGFLIRKGEMGLFSKSGTVYGNLLKVNREAIGSMNRIADSLESSATNNPAISRKIAAFKKKLHVLRDPKKHLKNRQEIVDMAHELARETPSELGEALINSVEDFNITTLVQRPFASKINKALTNDIFQVLKHKVYDVVADGVRRAKVLFAVEDASRKAAKEMAASVTKFIAPATTDPSKIATAIRSSGALLGSQLSTIKDPETGKESKPKDKQEAIRNIQTNIEDFKNNPEKLQNRLIKNTIGLASTAPKIAAEIRETGTRAAAFLAQKFPTKPINEDNPLLTRLTNYRRTLSTAEVADLEKYMQAIENPISVVQDFGDGVMTPQGVEVLKAVYPSIYTELQHKLIEKISTTKQEFPYEKRLQANLLFGLPSDYSLTPKAITSLQSAHIAETASPQHQTVKPTVTGIGKLDRAGRSETETERIARGEN